MNVNGASDIARMQALQKRALNTRAALDIAGTEMNTGEKADRLKATGGNLTRLLALERALDRTAVFSDTAALTEVRLDIMQEGLGQILARTQDLSLELIDAVNTGDQATAMMHAAQARNDFAHSVGILNTQVAGQSLFAGTATDTPALALADDILAELDLLVAGAPDAATAIALVEGYFTPPAGGFFATGYVGSTDDLTPVEIGDGERLNYALRADDAGLVAVLQSQALAAVAVGGALAGNAVERMLLLGESGAQMLAAKEGVLDLRAQVGRSQEAVELAQAARVSEKHTYEMARAGIVSIDPLEAASRFQALEVQLESIYTVTSRIAGLRFANFMR